MNDETRDAFVRIEGQLKVEVLRLYMKFRRYERDLKDHLKRLNVLEQAAMARASSLIDGDGNHK